MDLLVSKRVKLSDVPKEEEKQRRPMGRLGELWLKVLALGPEEAECVENMDAQHAGYTKRHMMRKANAAKIDIQAKRVGTQVYFWRAPSPKIKADSA